jgi:hypothetical protein
MTAMELIRACAFEEEGEGTKQVYGRGNFGHTGQPWTNFRIWFWSGSHLHMFANPNHRHMKAQYEGSV